MPLSWGGTKRAAVEIEQTFRGGPFDRVLGGAAVWERTNPFYELDENRREAWIEASRQIVKGLRASGRAAYGETRFGAIEETTATYGADLTFDTRLDPVFPRNAVYASAGWSGSTRRSRRRSTASRRKRAPTGDSSGSRCCRCGCSTPAPTAAQPDYARYLLGGAASLRGYRAGSFSGDNVLGASAELRIPISSPMGIAKAGVTLFTDVGTVWNDGQRLADQRCEPGAGARVLPACEPLPAQPRRRVPRGLGHACPLLDGAAVLKLNQVLSCALTGGPAPVGWLVPLPLPGWRNGRRLVGRHHRRPRRSLSRSRQSLSLPTRQDSWYSFMALAKNASACALSFGVSTPAA